MRRSRHVATLLAGTASLLILSACDEEQVQDPLYSDVAACAAENPRDECERAFAASKEWHQERTDRFGRKAECEAQFGEGNCETVSRTNGDGSTTSYFMPALMGFMLARSLSGIGGYPAGYPVYFDRQGYAYAGGSQIGQCAPNETCGRTGSATSSSSSRTGSSFSSSSSSRRYSITPSTSDSAGASTRGGFGSTASRMSSGSSS